MSKYLIMITLLFSMNALCYPTKLEVTYPNNSRHVVIEMSDLSLTYMVNGSKHLKSFDELTKRELDKKWEEILPLLKKSKNDYVCGHAIHWEVELKNKEKYSVCKNLELGQKLGDFQKSLQMLMIQ